MISLVVPTRNRAHTLIKVLPSYFEQEGVDELIFVSDAGTDASQEIVHEVATQFPAKHVQFIRNDTRKGASLCRNIGVAACKNEFVLFCDDDEYLEEGYARICMAKLTETNAGAVSGRRIYMRSGESPERALLRFGTGMRESLPFRYLICEYVNGARYDGDIELPFTNAIILTRSNLVKQFPFDGYYARGNGYREETDFQMNLFVHGIRIVATNDCHSFHLPISEVKSGGQRTGRLRRIYWSIYYTSYFYKKYYNEYAKRLKLSTPRPVALAFFIVFALYRELARPFLYNIWLSLTSSRKSTKG